jgi:hypothetical protein
MNLKSGLATSDPLARRRAGSYAAAMKTLLAVLVALGFALTAMAQPYPSGKASPKAGAAAKDAKGKDAKGKGKQEEEPKIAGMEIARGDKGFIGLEVAEGAFKMTFYDKEKKPTPPDVARAALRWDAKYKVGQERLVLNPGGGPNSLNNPRVIRPPYNFKLFITLIKAGGADGDNATGESYVVDFRQ